MLNIVLVPAQIGESDTVNCDDGIGFTVTVAVATAAQPFALVTVTVYGVVAAGLTVMAAVAAPLLQAYVPPPDAVNIVEAPAQITVLPVIVAVGSGFTTTVAVATAVQPVAFVTTTE
jgi:hypothetical protein